MILNFITIMGIPFGIEYLEAAGFALAPVDKDDRLWLASHGWCNGGPWCFTPLQIARTIAVSRGRSTM